MQKTYNEASYIAKMAVKLAREKQDFSKKGSDKKNDSIKNNTGKQYEFK